jgi:superfamily II DNA or RNA helicase
MLNLRHYQDKSIASLRNGFVEGHRSQMLYMPTGAGKTESAISLLLATQEAGNAAAMILDRRVLCEQTSNRLDKYGIDHGVLMSGHWRYRPDRKIQICSAQTLEARGSFPGLKLLIIDEAHAVRKATADFVKSTSIKTIGLSASPFTKGLANLYTNVVSEVTTNELVNEGSLVPLKVFSAKEIDMEGAAKVAGEWSQKDATERGIKVTGDIVSEWIKKTHEIFGEPKKTIVFCAGVQHGADLSQKFAEAGYNFVSISYKDDDEFKQEAIAEFSKPDSSIHGLIAVDILTKGFDVPDVMIGVSARPFTKSFSSHVQQMGRVMRPFEGKEFGLWIDHSGNYLRFREEWDDLYHNGVKELFDGKEKPKREPTKKEKEAAKCPKCSHIWPSRSDTCAHCGFVREKSNTVLVQPGQLVEVDGSAKADSDEKKSFYHQLLYYAEMKGYADGWAFHQYLKRFKVQPRWPKMREPVTKQVMNWIKSQQIAYAKAKAKA